MSDFFKILLLFVIAVFIGAVTSHLNYTEFTRSGYGIVSGFPFGIFRTYLTKTVILGKEIVDVPYKIYLINSIFWFISLFVLFQGFKKMETVRFFKSALFSGLLGAFLLYIKIVSTDQCLAGYPIPFYSKCTDVLHSALWIGLLDYIFWLAVALIGLGFFLKSYKYNKIVMTIALSLVLLGFSLAYGPTSCGFICFSNGPGFPLGFLPNDYYSYGGSRSVSWFNILADYIFWLFISVISISGWYFYKKTKKSILNE